VQQTFAERTSMSKFCDIIRFTATTIYPRFCHQVDRQKLIKWQFERPFHRDNSKTRSIPILLFFQQIIWMLASQYKWKKLKIAIGYSDPRWHQYTRFKTNFSNSFRYIKTQHVAHVFDPSLFALKLIVDKNKQEIAPTTSWQKCYNRHKLQ
jgi:hypothetical protein